MSNFLACRKIMGATSYHTRGQWVAVPSVIGLFGLDFETDLGIMSGGIERKKLLGTTRQIEALDETQKEGHLLLLCARTHNLYPHEL